MGKYVMSHFPHTEEEALQTALRYDLIYAQFDYVYTIIPYLPVLEVSMHQGHLMPPMLLLEPFHILRHILSILMVIRRGAPVPPTHMALLLATCFSNPNPSTKLFLLLMHSLVL